MKIVNSIFASAFLPLLVAHAEAQNSTAGPLERVLDHYVTVQKSLARDSLKDVSAGAQAIVLLARDDKTEALSPKIVQQAEALAKASSLAKAREAFEPLSESLIAQLKTGSSPSGVYYEMYCPTAEASWLQTDRRAGNPYLGLRSATPTWGWACSAELKGTFGNRSSRG